MARAAHSRIRFQHASSIPECFVDGSATFCERNSKKRGSAVTPRFTANQLPRAPPLSRHHICAPCLNDICNRRPALVTVRRPTRFPLASSVLRNSEADWEATRTRYTDTSASVPRHTRRFDGSKSAFEMCHSAVLEELYPVARADSRGRPV